MSKNVAIPLFTPRLVTYYELKEATTMFELALWKSKSKLDQADASNTTNRTAY
jgi:hypothetical protein